MTTTERTTALGGDEAAEQRSAPNLEAGVVGDLVAEDFAVIKRCAHNLPKLYRRGQHAGYYQHSDVSDLIDIIGRLRAALAKYATHQPAISTDIGPFSQAKIPGGDASNGADQISDAGHRVIEAAIETVWDAVRHGQSCGLDDIERAVAAYQIATGAAAEDGSLKEAAAVANRANAAADHEGAGE